MNTIFPIPQNNSLHSFHAVSGQFDLFKMSDLPLDRRATTPPTLLPPMPVIADTGPSFETIMERYFSEVVEVGRAQKGQDFVRSLLRSCIYPTLASRPLAEITRSEILALTKAIGTTRLKPYLDRVDGRTGRANSVHWLLRRFWVWAATRCSLYRWMSACKTSVRSSGFFAQARNFAIFDSRPSIACCFG